MKCVKCGDDNSKVLESRDLVEGNSIRRRRQCLGCGLRFTTYERVERPYLSVVKKNGEREAFLRDKLAGGIYKAFEKRPIAHKKVENLISSIESEIFQSGEAEIESNQIGELVMVELAKLDDVAYVRFASVYRSFADLESFQHVMDKLKQSRHED